MKKLALLLIAAARLIGVEFTDVLNDSRHWCDVEIPASEIILAHGEPDFRFGVSTCTYQDSGAHHCPNSQWAQWEKEILPEENRSGKAANFYELYQSAEGREQIIKRLKLLGVNSYRFSIEWSQIQPEPDAWNDDVVQIYVDLCKHLRDEGIYPMVTLHHFSEPQWFHEMGSFEKRENIHHYVDFAVRAFKALTPIVDTFCTINEPNIEGFQRYISGEYSPGEVRNFEKASHFIKHMLIAHCHAYRQMKEHCPSAQIGVVHQYLKFIPSNPAMSLVTYPLTSVINDAMLNFFKTKGHFYTYVPGYCYVDETCEVDVKTDFVGLQYYVRAVVSCSGSDSFHEPMTNTAMNFREDPEGIYEAIVEAHSAYGVPIIITENGISTHNEVQRSRYMRRSLQAVEQARNIIGKENLIGYHCWSLPHVFEWNYGMRPEAFGLFELYENGELSEEPKPGADSFMTVVQNWRKSNQNYGGQNP